VSGSRRLGLGRWAKYQMDVPSSLATQFLRPIENGGRAL
jgi:hypothetical protein